MAHGKHDTILQLSFVMGRKLHVHFHTLTSRVMLDMGRLDSNLRLSFLTALFLCFPYFPTSDPRASQESRFNVFQRFKAKDTHISTASVYVYIYIYIE